MQSLTSSNLSMKGKGTSIHRGVIFHFMLHHHLHKTLDNNGALRGIAALDVRDHPVLRLHYVGTSVHPNRGHAGQQ
jgi:hypothetical protein